MRKLSEALVIEDSLDTAEVISVMLKNGHFNVTQTDNGIDALDLVKLKSFDVAIVDLHLPYVDGWRVASLLKEQGFQGKLIACSGEIFDEQEFWSTPHCFDEYVLKPFSQAQLMQSIFEK